MARDNEHRTGSTEHTSGSPSVPSNRFSLSILEDADELEAALPGIFIVCGLLIITITICWYIIRTW